MGRLDTHFALGDPDGKKEEEDHVRGYSGQMVTQIGLSGELSPSAERSADGGSMCLKRVTVGKRSVRLCHCPIYEE